MTMTSDERVLKKLMRRVRAGRGSVYLEFALIAPLAMSLVCFAADFSRILQAEQQVEICARVLADLEAHYDHPRGTGQEDVIPFTKSKMCVAEYLRDTLQLRDKDGKLSEYVVLNKASIEKVDNVLSPIEKIFDFAEEDPDDSWFMKLVRWVFKNVINILFGGTQEYLANMCRCDRMIKATTSVSLRTLFPGSAYSYICFVGDGGDFVNVIPMKYKMDASTRKPDFSEAETYYCHMPHMETLETGPETWIRKAERNFRTSPIVGICQKLGLMVDDYMQEVEE